MDRMLRVNELLKRELGLAFERLVRGRVSGLVTVTEVRTAPDLRTAIVLVSVYGKDEAKQRALQVLHEERSELQRLIGRNVKLKFTPRLEFRLDEKLAQADHLLQVMERLEQQDSAHAGVSREGTAPAAGEAAAEAAAEGGGGAAKGDKCEPGVAG